MFTLSCSMAKFRMFKPCSNIKLGSFSIGKPNLSKLSTSSSMIAKTSLCKLSKLAESCD